MVSSEYLVRKALVIDGSRRSVKRKFTWWENGYGALRTKSAMLKGEKPRSSVAEARVMDSAMAEVLDVVGRRQKLVEEVPDLVLKALPWMTV